MKKNEQSSLKVNIVTIVTTLTLLLMLIVTGYSFYAAPNNLEQTSAQTDENTASAQKIMNSPVKNQAEIFPHSVMNSVNQNVGFKDTSTDKRNSVPKTTQSLKSPLNAAECIQASISVTERLLSFSTEMKLELNLLGDSYQGIGEYAELSLRKDAPKIKKHKNEQGEIEEEESYIEVRNPLEWNVFRLKVKMLPQNSKASDPSQEDNIYVVTSDQRALWRYSRIEGQERLEHLDIQELANHLSRLSDEEKRTLMQNGVVRSCGMSGLPFLGGMSGMLKSLLVNYDFQPKMIFGNLKNDLKEDYPAWKLTGKMKKDKLDEIKKQLLDYHAWKVTEAKLDFLPTDVEILMSIESMFPCQIKYYCTGLQGRQLLMKINFNNIKFNGIMENLEDFTYETPNKTYEQFGESYIRQLIPNIEL